MGMQAPHNGAKAQERFTQARQLGRLQETQLDLRAWCWSDTLLVGWLGESAICSMRRCHIHAFPHQRTPHLNGAVVAARHSQPAVRGHGHRPHPVLVAGEGAGKALRGQRPDLASMEQAWSDNA
jgi:hypothetical protein